MIGDPAPKSDLNPAAVVEGVDWYGDGFAGVSGSRLDQLSRNPRNLLDSLNQEQRTITNQTDLQNETLLSIKDPNVRTSKKTHLNQEQRTITNQTDLQNETERGGAEVRAGRHMPSASES